MLAPLPRSDVGRVQHLILPDHQEPFVGNIADMTADPDPAQEFHHICAGDQMIGFFKVDTDFARRVKRLPKGSHGLRGVLIGGQFQGMGFGRRFLELLPGYLPAQYDVTEVWLSVDQGNKLATRLYLATGWEITGPPFTGRSGLETVLRLKL